MGWAMPEIEVVTDEEGMAAALAIRHAVFRCEQGVSEADEIDGLDGICRHYLLRELGAPVGAARIRALDGGEVKVERMAVREGRRGVGLGRALMERIVADAAAAGAPAVVLNAQTSAAGFYVRLGFRAEGGEFLEAGIPHVRMARSFRR